MELIGSNNLFDNTIINVFMSAIEFIFDLIMSFIGILGVFLTTLWNNVLGSSLGLIEEGIKIISKQIILSSLTVFTNPISLNGIFSTVNILNTFLPQDFYTVAGLLIAIINPTGTNSGKNIWEVDFPNVWDIMKIFRDNGKLQEALLGILLYYLVRNIRVISTFFGERYSPNFPGTGDPIYRLGSFSTKIVKIPIEVLIKNIIRYIFYNSWDLGQTVLNLISSNFWGSLTLSSIENVKGVYGEAFVHSTLSVEGRNFNVVAQFNVLPDNIGSHTWNGKNSLKIDVDMTVNVAGIGSYYSQVKTLTDGGFLIPTLSDAYYQLKNIPKTQNPAKILPTAYVISENTVYCEWLQEFL